MMTDRYKIEYDNNLIRSFVQREAEWLHLRMFSSLHKLKNGKKHQAPE